MNLRNIGVKKLTKENFVPYGHVIEIPDSLDVKLVVLTERFNRYPKLGVTKVNRGELQVNDTSKWKCSHTLQDLRRYGSGNQSCY